MRTDASKTITSESPEDRRGTSIDLALPIRESELFKHGASPHILNFLSDNPDITVSLRQLATVTPLSERATREAVEVLEANGLVETVHQGNARRVQINRDRLTKPDDPIRSILQTQFQLPVRVARHYIEDELDDVRGIILFGSVARGEADRQSDIDLWILVGDERVQQRHKANKLAQHLEDFHIPQSIAISEANAVEAENEWETFREQLEADEHQWPDAQRYSYELVVETPQSILNQADRVDAEKLFSEGITILSTETLERVKLEMVSDE
jgi:predicted nucleotidyltransferase